MKKLVLLAFVITVSACSSTKTADTKKPLFEVLTTQNDGGANIRFYEILTEEREIQMLLGDENLKKKITAEDMKKANFIILNMGEKSSAGHSIKVTNVTETEDSVIVDVEESAPAQGTMSAAVVSYPYAIVKINSKKKIVIK
jgi:protease stability complex PrcB-like protein